MRARYLRRKMRGGVRVVTARRREEQVEEWEEDVPMREWNNAASAMMFDADGGSEGCAGKSVPWCMMRMLSGHMPTRASASAVADSVQADIAAVIEGGGCEAWSQNGERERADINEEQVGGYARSGVRAKACVVPAAA